MTLPNPTQTFDGLKIVHISDLNVSRFMTKQRLQKIVDLINQQQADLVVITGDFATQYQPFKPDLLIQQLKKITTHTTTLAVLSNHDHWHQTAAEIRKILAASQVIELNNQVYLLERNREKFAIAGIDDPYLGFDDLDRVLNQLPETGAAILLVHEQDFVEITANTGRFDLQLSGHSHGGQIVIPFRGALALPNGDKKYFLGLNQIGNTQEYTNRGIGMTALPIRFGSRPEITVFTLKAP